MRKYIHIAKAVTPVLTEEAANHIAEEYSRLRSQEQMGADIARVGGAHTQTHKPMAFCRVRNRPKNLRLAAACLS